METLFRKVANVAVPRADADIESEGYLLLRPSENPYVVARNEYGDGLEENDRVVTWSLAEHELSPDKIKAYESLVDEIFGDPALVTASKAAQLQNGGFTGGIEFERTLRCLGELRCYGLGTTFQIPRQMSAPVADSRMSDLDVDPHLRMRRKLLQLGANCAMQNVRKGPPSLLKVLQQQAELTNMPRIGTDDNVAHPSFQLNAASATEPSQPGPSPNIDAIGKFGGNHPDTGESKGSDTSLITLSKKYAGVYDDIFFLLDLGIAWVKEHLSTISFSGLHLHSGHQPMYRPGREDPDHIHYRLTLVGYSPESVLDGYEMRFPLINNFLAGQRLTTQATYVTDGMAIMERTSMMRFLANGAVELLLTLLSQSHPSLLARLDPEKLIAAISYVNEDGIRVQAPKWDLAPGWSGKDVRLGVDYKPVLRGTFGVSSTQELKSEDVARLWNSDDLETEHPFNNPNLMAARDVWSRHVAAQGANIPIAVVADSEVVAVGTRCKPQRLALMRSVQNLPKTKRKRQDDNDRTSHAKLSRTATNSEPANSLLRISPGFLVNVHVESITNQIKEVERVSQGDNIETSMVTARSIILEAISADAALVERALGACQRSLLNPPQMDYLLLPPLPCFPAPVAIPNPDLFERFWRFLHTSLSMIQPQFRLPPEALSLRKATSKEERKKVLYVRLLVYISENEDIRLAFRDSTPSQARILIGLGPYSPHHVKTIGGFFSALVYRGVTHGSAFLRQHPQTVFLLSKTGSNSRPRPSNLIFKIILSIRRLMGPMHHIESFSNVKNTGKSPIILHIIRGLSPLWNLSNLSNSFLFFNLQKFQGLEILFFLNWFSITCDVDR